MFHKKPTLYVITIQFASMRCCIMLGKNDSSACDHHTQGTDGIIEGKKKSNINLMHIALKKRKKKTKKDKRQNEHERLTQLFSLIR